MAQKANAETENLERLLKESQVQVEAYKKDIDSQKFEKEHLEKRVSEVWNCFISVFHLGSHRWIENVTLH